MGGGGTGLAYRRLHAVRQLLGGPLPPIVQEVYGRFCSRHVVVDSHDFDAVLPQGREHGRDLGRLHGDVTSDDRVVVTAVKRGPRVQAHARVDVRTHFLDRQVGTTDGYFVDVAVLFARLPHDLREPLRVQLTGQRTARSRRGGRWALADERDSGSDSSGDLASFPMTVDVHIEDAGAVIEEVVVQGRHFEAVVEHC